MYKFDLAISYTWKYDFDFVELVENIFLKHGISTFVIHKKNIFDVTDAVKKNVISFKAYIDRGSDADEDFAELAEILSRGKTYIINHYDKVETSVDKAIMHQKLINSVGCLKQI